MITVPDNTIAVLPLKSYNNKKYDMKISSSLKPLNTDHKRDWFTSHFYKCLPLSIGNMQGFSFSLPFNFEVLWNGGMGTEDIDIWIDESSIDPEIENIQKPKITSEFGHGIFTAHAPVILKTPPGINLMTIAPPNFPTPLISPMTGVVEADNLRFTFTLNFKIDVPDIRIPIKKDYPIMGIIPIPRRFCDSFNLVDGYDIFDQDLIEEEKNIADEHANIRKKNNLMANMTGKYDGDRLYYKGVDAHNNKFQDHQLPKEKS